MVVPQCFKSRSCKFMREFGFPRVPIRALTENLPLNSFESNKSHPKTNVAPSFTSHKLARASTLHEHCDSFPRFLPSTKQHKGHHFSSTTYCLEVSHSPCKYRKVIFQPSFFRGYAKLCRCTIFKGTTS